MPDNIFRLISESLPEPYSSELLEETLAEYDRINKEMLRNVVNKINLIVDQSCLKSEGYPGLHLLETMEEKLESIRTR
jgi:hypothetical protein